MGLVDSQTSSRGRYGYGTQYKLLVPPEMIGNVCASPEWWSEIVNMKAEHVKGEDQSSSLFRIAAPRSGRKKFSVGFLSDTFDDYMASTKADRWEKFVGPK